MTPSRNLADAPTAVLPRVGGGRPRLAVLDGLRLIAALMVAMYHFSGFEPGVNPAWGDTPAATFPGLYHLSSYGWMGVELFFLISGFVICMSSWGRTLGGFFRSRLTRLYPAYWPAVLITTAVVALWPTVREALRPSEVLLNLSMLNAPLGVPYVDGVYWSLWAEARFYLLFAVALLWRGGGLTLRRVTVFGYAWLLVGVLSVNSGLPILKTVFQPEYAPLFVAGIAYYLIHRFGSDIALWGLVGASFLLAVHNSVKRIEHVGPDNLHRPLSTTAGLLLLTSYFVVMGVIAMGWTTRVQWRWLTTAGLLTYPFYLLHEHIGWTLIHGTRDLAPPWVVLVLVLTAMLFAAWLLHKLVEKPVAKWLKGHLDAASTAGRAAGTHQRAATERPAPAEQHATGTQAAAGQHAATQTQAAAGQHAATGTPGTVE